MRSRTCFDEVVRAGFDPGATDGLSRSSLRACVADDLRRSTWWQRSLLLATVGWIAYEWGFGNETVTPWVLVRVVSSTSGLWSVIATVRCLG